MRKQRRAAGAAFESCGVRRTVVRPLRAHAL